MTPGRFRPPPGYRPGARPDPGHDMPCGHVCRCGRQSFACLSPCGTCATGSVAAKDFGGKGSAR
jgi:hypothetical protein